MAMKQYRRKCYRHFVTMIPEIDKTGNIVGLVCPDCWAEEHEVENLKKEQPVETRWPEGAEL